jgi:peroxiredoxin
MSWKIPFFAMFLMGMSASPSKLQQKLYEDVYSTFADKTTQDSTTVIRLTEIGKKYPIVIVNFWASWCTPCLKEFKGMNELLNKFGKDKIFILGINEDQENALKEIAEVEKKQKLQFASVSDLGHKYQNQFGVNSLPTTIIFSKGKVIYTNYEYTDFLSKKIVELISPRIN